MIAGAFFSLLAGFSAIGDNGDPTAPIVWPADRVPLWIGRAGSDDIDGDADLAAIRNAIAAWNQPSCTDLQLVEEGLLDAPNDGDDGRNVIYFRENNWPGGLSGAAAVTVHHENDGAPDTWRDADILLNGQDLAWSTTGEVQKFDIHSAVLHELGHLIGLKHAADPRASMYFVAPRGTTYRRTLHERDIAGVCWLYPASGARSCTGDEACPLMISPNGTARRLSCTNGQCAPGSVSYGNECLDDRDCNDGDCTRDPDTAAGDDPGFCTASCASAACSNGDFCAAGTSCFLGRDDCVRDADCNQNNVVCALDLDGRRRCSALCIRDTNCAPNEVCHGGTGANPPGFCRAPGAGGDGAPCDDGYDCSSLFCAGSAAATVCIGGAAVPVEDAGVIVAPDARPNVEDAEPGVDRAVSPNSDAEASGDAGIIAGDAGSEGELEGSGCGCAAAAGASASPALAIFALLLLLRTRRRDRSP